MEEDRKSEDFWETQYYQLEQMVEMELAEKKTQLTNLKEELIKAKLEMEAKDGHIVELKTQLDQRDGMIVQLNTIANSGATIIRGMQKTEKTLRGEIENLQLICALQQSETEMTHEMKDVSKQGDSSSRAVEAEPGLEMHGSGKSAEINWEDLSIEELKAVLFEQEEMLSYMKASEVNLAPEISIGGAPVTELATTADVAKVEAAQVEINPLERTLLVSSPALVAPNVDEEKEEVAKTRGNTQPEEHSRDWAKPNLFSCTCGETFRVIGGLEKHIGRHTGNPYSKIHT